MRTKRMMLSAVLLSLIMAAAACNNRGGVSPHTMAHNWMWVSGSNTVDRTGIYGTKGMADAANVPGARRYTVSWTDSRGNLWLFGGYGHGAAKAEGDLNDLWRFDGTNWTWVNGSEYVGYIGIYGTKGVPDAANVPGARDSAVSWTDSSGNLWLFGGYGCDAAGVQSYLNDLWRFDGTNWMWIGGSNTVNQNGIYGTKGVPGATYVPGARDSAVSWTDSRGNFWLFGGYGRDATGASGYLNDLWRFDGTNWTWVSGSKTIDRNGIYGTKGVASAANVPGARYGTVSWTDSKGNLWLFGGYGRDAAGPVSALNDLWRFDGTNWTWVSGSNTVNQNGIYGTKGVASAANVPGARYGAVSWTGSKGNLWLFGGYGRDAAGASGHLNDLWRYNP